MGELAKLTHELLGTQAARIKTFQKQINTQCHSVLPSSPMQGWTWGWGGGARAREGGGEVGGLCSARPARPLGCAPSLPCSLGHQAGSAAQV